MHVSRLGLTPLKGTRHVDLEHVDLTRGTKQLLHDATWRLGPGDRVGIVGVNGAGKSSVLALVSGDLQPDAGRVKRGRTIALEHLTQHVPVEDPDARVLPSIEDIRRVTRLSTGKDVSASSMLERFGFTGDKLTARLGDLSGGERRRFQLLKLLLSEPNVLLLDEPTNDLDIETLNVVEDFLDGWPGTLIVVSHDRYFLERVTDSVWALMGDGQIAMLPRGVDEYLETRRHVADESQKPVETSQMKAQHPRGKTKAKVGGADERSARKAINRIDKQLARITSREVAVTDEMAVNADSGRLKELSEEMHRLADERGQLEEEWLEAAALLE